ncbi:MAG: sensor domain-containing diguanylate cyclase [Candidatus Omnitrophota bacterium]
MPTLFFIIIIAVCLTASAKILPLKVLLGFYLINILIGIYFFSKNSKLKYQFQLRLQDIQEKINILNDQNSLNLKNNISLQEKIKRYEELKKIIEKINQNLSLDYIAESFTDIAFSLVGVNKGVCILYLIDNQIQKPVMFKTRKEDSRMVIKNKQGDIFDQWVLRHTGPLLVEDIKKDFRFDTEKLNNYDLRPIQSLISVPLKSANRILGIMRLDNSQREVYTQEDLRLLVTIADIAAVAVENGELFQKTRDLAIHDGLTGLYTKGYFIERLRDECKRGVSQCKPVSLLMIDIDYFKKYNDEFGHAAGDIVLKNLGDCLYDFAKDYPPCLISRFGGEEFCILLSDRDKKSAAIIAEGLMRKIKSMKLTLRRQEINITVSIGVASLPCDASEEEEFIRAADMAMYEAKNKGRDKIVVA